MSRINFSAIKPHLIAIVTFIIISFAYFSPLLEGKRLRQHDTMQHKGMSKEIVDFRNQTGEEALWTNSMFGGMPSFQISTLYPSNLMRHLDRLLQLYLPGPASVLFLCLIGFYFLLLTLRVDPRLSIAGAILFAFSSYFFVILSAGHNSKAHAIAYMAPVIAGVLITFRGEYLKGGIITAVALALEVLANHFQITYYLGLITVALVIFKLYGAFRDGKITHFLKASAVLIIAVILAFSTNITSLWNTYEYSKFSTRGPSDLSAASKSSGLDKEYATGWSYGVAETMTLLIPNFMGGASEGELSTSSVTYKAFQDAGMSPQQAKQYIKRMPLYWGDQPSTAGPVYFGAIACFLFILGLFLVKGRLKWWLLSVTCLSILFSWGKNFGMFTDFVFDYLPGYNKFRAVSMGLVIAQFSVPLLGLLALRSFFEDNTIPGQEKQRSLLRSLYITGGVVLLFILIAGGLFDFTSEVDNELKQGGWPDALLNALREDRESMLRMDALRSLFFIGSAFAVLYFFLKNRIKREAVFVALALLILVDLWPVDKRYLNNDNFAPKKQVLQPFQPTQADLQIRQDPDPNYRVLNLSANTFNDAGTSYFHKSIGGYHAAKPKRYQELIEAQISKNNMAVLNMLNTKYFIVPGRDESKEPVAQRNPDALGNAWFVKEYKLVANADSELNALTNFNPAQVAIIDKRFQSFTDGYKPSFDSTASIKLTSYKPNHLVYKSSANAEQLAVFSEMYYDKGWEAYVDSKPAPHFRVNYILRAMRIPAGDHTVEFKFRPASYHTGEKISLICSSMLLVLLAGVVYMEIKGRPKQ